MPKNGSLLLLDGYNLLLGLAERERTRDVGERLPELRRTLLQLLSDWASERERNVVVVWDGKSDGAAAGSNRLRVVFVDPPAEADDWIVNEATVRSERGLPTEVLTRDRGLRTRLPEEVELLSFERFERDLRSLAADPVVAPHVTGPSGSGELFPWTNETSDEIDTSRLPRRRTQRRVTGDIARAETLPGGKRGAVHEIPGSPERSVDPRTAAKDRRDARRRRWERARQRRQARGPRKRRAP